MKRILFLILFFNCFISKAQLKVFFSEAINSTILLYKKDKGNLIPHGTAFSFYNYGSNADENILVTCEHLTHHDTLIASIPASDSIRNELVKSNYRKINYMSNAGMQSIEFDGNNFLFKIPLKLNFNLFKHPYLDLAVIFCTIPSVLNNMTSEVILTNSKRLPKSYICSKNEIYAGQEITFIGFPYGIGTTTGFYGSKIYGDLKANPLLRKG